MVAEIIAAYGGVTAFEFRTDGSVDAKWLNVSEDTVAKRRPS